MPKHYYKNKKYQGTGLSLKKPLEYRMVRASAVGLFTFLVTLLACSVFAPVQISSAEEVFLANQATGGSVSLTTSGNIDLSLESNAVGVPRTVADAVRVTAGNSGYQLYLSTSSGENALIRDGAVSTGTDSTTGLPIYASADLIPAGGGDTITSPTTLTNNTWGFAVAAKNNTSDSGSEDVLTNGFDSTYPTGDDSVATSKFAKVPAKGQDVLIAKRSASGTNILTNVYYGTKVTSAKPSGTYKNTITYTAIGDSSTSGLASVTPERTDQLGGGATITISTPSTTALDSLGTITVTVGGEACANPTTAKNGSLNNVTCNAPALATG